MLYITYKCTVCRRKKDIGWDSQRVVPLHCTITKGCEGSLSPIGQTTVPTPVLPIDGVEDWYPRNQEPVKSTASTLPTDAYLNTSPTGGLVLAIQEDDENFVPSTIVMTLSQRRGESVSFSQYLFRSASTSTISGRDVNGKNLRFDSTAIDDGRVFVRVNGVLRTIEMTLTPNTISFTSPISGSVDVIVYDQPVYDERTLSFSRNKFGDLTSTRGSWYNIDKVWMFTNGVYKKWWVFTCDEITDIGNGKLKITQIKGEPSPLYQDSDVMMLHAGSPYATIDRTLTHVVPMVNLTSDFIISFDSAISPRFVIPWESLTEIYPPLVLHATDKIEVDPVQTTASSSVIVDNESNVALPSSKILGPV